MDEDRFRSVGREEMGKRIVGTVFGQDSDLALKLGKALLLNHHDTLLEVSDNRGDSAYSSQTVDTHEQGQGKSGMLT